MQSVAVLGDVATGYVTSVFPVAGQEGLAAIPSYFLPPQIPLVAGEACGAVARAGALHPTVAGLHVPQGAWTSRSRCSHVLAGDRAGGVGHQPGAVSE